jgi:Fe2+ transport system protein B
MFLSCFWPNWGLSSNKEHKKDLIDIILEVAEFIIQLISPMDIPKQQVTMMMLPLHCFDEIFTQLHHYVRIAEQLENNVLFDQDIAAFASLYFWDLQGKKTHVDQTIRYFLFVAFATTCLYVYYAYYIHGDISTTTQILMFIYLIILFSFLFRFAGEEFSQLYGHLKESLPSLSSSSCSCCLSSSSSACI